MKVDALIMGTQKGGTTALFRFLTEHPQLSVPREIKEAHFFDNEEAFARGAPDLSKYHRLFGEEPGRRLRLEATPIYMYWKPAGPRIAAYNPRMRLIFILRDPVERAVSQWEMEYSRGTETEGFAAALELERERNRRSPGEQHRVRSYLERGFYGEQLTRLLGLFPRSQMLILKREELLEAHERTLGRVCEFLGLSPFARVPESRMVFPTEKSRDLPPVSEALRAELRRGFADDLRKLAALSGLDVSGWL